MQQGTLKFSNHARGFGFIEPDDGGNYIFVHATQLRDGLEALTVGDRVTFDIAKTAGRATKSDRGQARRLRDPKAAERETLPRFWLTFPLPPA